MKYKILVTGADGLVGSRFCELYKDSHTILEPTLVEFDLFKPETIQEYISKSQPDVIVHCAAFTDVSVAEKQRGDQKGSCWQVNVEGTAHVVDLCQRQKIALIAISTDVVFSATAGYPGPYIENAELAESSDQISWYGWTKAEAERRLANLNDVAIVRISNPVRREYGLKRDYVHKILDLYDQAKLYPMFNDQYLTLTYIDEVAKALDAILQKKLTGIFHVSSNDRFTPFELASYLLERARGASNVVQPISLAEFIKKTGNPARYPQYGGLDVKLSQARLGLQFLSWRQIIDQIVNFVNAS